MSQMTIVLLIALLMLILFISGKFPYGLITMSCCALLALTGVYDIPTAFSGLSNKMIVMIASMFALGGAFGKTSLTEKLKQQMILLNGKKGILLVAAMFLIVIVMIQFMSVTVTLTMMIGFIMALGTDGEVTPSKIMMPMLMVTAGWTCLTPIGMGATNYMSDNVLIGGVVQNEDQLFKVFDYFKVGLLPGVVILVYALMIWRFIPNGDVNTGNLKEVKAFVSPFTRAQEMLVYALFAGVFLVIIFFSEYAYIAPVVAVVTLAFTKTVSTRDLVADMTSDAVWMMAGVVVVAKALTESGAGELIGNTILNILGGTDNKLFIMSIFSVTAVLMTTFLSNSATWNVLMPVAASVALAGGWDPRGLCLIVSIGSNFAFAFPTGSNQSALIFSTAGYSPFKMAKFTIPAVLLMIIALVISANFWFPLY